MDTTVVGEITLKPAEEFWFHQRGHSLGQLVDKVVVKPRCIILQSRLTGTPGSKRLAAIFFPCSPDDVDDVVNSEIPEMPSQVAARVIELQRFITNHQPTLQEV